MTAQRIADLACQLQRTHDADEAVRLATEMKCLADEYSRTPHVKEVIRSKVARRITELALGGMAAKEDAHRILALTSILQTLGWSHDEIARGLVDPALLFEDWQVGTIADGLGQD